MKYSVIIPCYEPKESDFRRCLDAIANQTIKPYEVIVVDDASNTKVAKIALEYGFTYTRHKVNKQNGGARNTGIRKATGDYLIFCNADDYFDLDTIEQIDKVNKGQDLIVVGFTVFGKGDNGTTFIPDGDPYIGKYNWNGEALHVVNRKYIIDNDLFELENVPIADKEWTTRIEKTMKTHTFVPKALYHYQVGHEGAIMTEIGKGNIVNNLTNPCYYDKDSNIELLIYEAAIPTVGGNTTFLIDFTARMSKYYNITLIYRQIDSYRLHQLSHYANCVEYKGQELTTDMLIWNSSWGEYPDTIKFKGTPIQMLHANYKEVYKMCGFEYRKPKIETRHIAVSHHVSEVFEDMYGIKSKVIHNMLFPDIKPKKVLNLITATRLTPEKGTKYLLRFKEELEKRDIKFIWLIFGTNNDKNVMDKLTKKPGIVFMGASYNFTDYTANADYMVHFSKTEGDCYCTKEALQVNTPCLTTAYPSTFEQIKDGENGYILPFDLFDKDDNEKDWDKFIDKIYNKIPEFEYKEPNLEKVWLEELGKPVGVLRTPTPVPYEQIKNKSNTIISSNRFARRNKYGF